MLIARSTETRLVAIYCHCRVDQRISFYCLETLMTNKCYISRGKLLGFGLIAKRRSGSGITIDNSPQHEEKDQRISQLP